MRALILSLLLALPALALPVGQPGPEFAGIDVGTGRWFELAAHRGQLVVLEWFNPDCPPWQAYYDPPFLQPMQERYAARGVVWVWICSKKGVTPARSRQTCAQMQAHPSAILLDGSGRLARLYDPKATPHVFLLGRDGHLLYTGAVDDGEDTNYLGQALDQALAGQPVTRPETAAFG